MASKYIICNRLLVLFGALMLSMVATSQDVVSPCPEVLIDQKYDHIPNHRYRAQGWDTAITCSQRMIELTSEPYVPVQYFNGTYLVEEVPFSPPDPTFSGGTKMPVGTDDDFASTTTELSFPFFFFGIRKTGFRLGANGLISFATDQFGGGNGCPWKYSAALPWTASTSGAPTMPEGASGSVPLARMRDAIYGVYEDTHPLAAYLTGQQGIYYGIQGEWPCRKIVCSWNGVPTYPGSSNLGNRCTYQIVCYEGSNIIEVHVKRRGVNTDWQNGVGLIGIQNATGEPQVPSDSIGAPNYFVEEGSPAAFWPTGMNTFNTTLDSVAYRFTPQGETYRSYSWFRIDEENDTIVELSTMAGDPDGYYVPMDIDPDHPTLTRAYVNPTVPSKYVLQLRFQNANGEWYNLSDTIFIGIDTTNTLMLRAESDGENSGATRRFDICRGQQPDVKVVYSDIQNATQIDWTVEQVRDGARMAMADSLYTLLDRDHTLRLNPVSKRNMAEPDRVDTVIVGAVVQFVSGCTNYDTLLLRLLPNYDTVEYHGICRGDTFVWGVDGNSYTESTGAARVNVGSKDGCDSVVRLNLTVFDVSHTVERRDDCKPLLWHNGRTYTEGNGGDNGADTVVLKNMYGCDSVVQLDFTIHPLTARIESDIDYFDYDHPDVVLRDVSDGGSGRQWYLPEQGVQTSEVVYYTIPEGRDSVEVMMVARSEYGCYDTALVVLPFKRQTMWLPNAFVPNSEDAGLARFAPVGIGIESLEMMVYDRQGRVMFHCVGTDCSWDGNDPSGTPCPQGGYVYVVRYTSRFEPTQMQSAVGAVTLIR